MPLSAQTKDIISYSLQPEFDGVNEFIQKKNELTEALSEIDDDTSVQLSKLSVSEELTEFTRSAGSLLWNCLIHFSDYRYVVEILEGGAPFPSTPNFLSSDDLDRSVSDVDFDKKWFPTEYVDLNTRPGSYFSNDFGRVLSYPFQLSEEDVIIPPSIVPVDIPAMWLQPLVGILPMLDAVGLLGAAPTMDKNILLPQLQSAFDFATASFLSNYSNFVSHVGASFPGSFSGFQSLANLVSTFSSSGLEANYLTWYAQANALVAQVEAEYIQFVSDLYAVFNRSYSRSYGYYWNIQSNLDSKQIIQDEIDSIDSYLSLVLKLDLS